MIESKNKVLLIFTGDKLKSIVSTGDIDVFHYNEESLPVEKSSDLSTPLAPDSGLLFSFDEDTFENYLSRLRGQAAQEE